MASPKRSPVEMYSQDQAKTDQTRSIASQDAAQGTLSQFEGPVQQSPFYKALLTAGTEGTAGAYKSAKSNVRARANAAGFGAAGQGVTEGATEGLENEEAKAQAQVPGQALLAAEGPAMTAAQTTAGIGATQGGQGLGYETGAVVPLEDQYQKAKAARQKALWGAGATLLGGPVGRAISNAVTST